MIFLIVLIAIVASVAIICAKNSWLQREYKIDYLVKKYPFLNRSTIKNTYENFLKNEQYL